MNGVQYRTLKKHHPYILKRAIEIEKQTISQTDKMKLLKWNQCHSVHVQLIWHIQVDDNLKPVSTYQWRRYVTSLCLSKIICPKCLITSKQEEKNISRALHLLCLPWEATLTQTLQSKAHIYCCSVLSKGCTASPTWQAQGQDSLYITLCWPGGS